MDLDFDTIFDGNYPDPTESTKRQRRALYRLGFSRSWVLKYAGTKAAASAAIQAALALRRDIENNALIADSDLTLSNLAPA
jgi:hypothetical protein